jgi:hypothetical protein
MQLQQLLFGALCDSQVRYWQVAYQHQMASGISTADFVSAKLIAYVPHACRSAVSPLRGRPVPTLTSCKTGCRIGHALRGQRATQTTQGSVPQAMQLAAW